MYFVRNCRAFLQCTCITFGSTKMCESFCCSASLPIFGIVPIYLFEELCAPYIGDPPSSKLFPESLTDGRVVRGRAPVPAPRHAGRRQTLNAHGEEHGRSQAGGTRRSRTKRGGSVLENPEQVPRGWSLESRLANLGPGSSTRWAAVSLVLTGGQ